MPPTGVLPIPFHTPAIPAIQAHDPRAHDSAAKAQEGDRQKNIGQWHGSKKNEASPASSLCSSIGLRKLGVCLGGNKEWENL